MKILPCNQTTFFDVDDTLVMWGRGQKGDPGVVEIICPASRYSRALFDLNQNSPLTSSTEEIVYEAGTWTEYLIPHKKHIEQMKLHKLRGHTIVVWSAGGWEWAVEVVKALGLEQYVDLVMEKPTWCYDDKQAEEYIPKSQWMKDE